MKRSLLKSAGIVSLSIFGSRILGLIRDVVIASLFGAGSLTDTFFVAFRIPNLLRRIFAEGAFSSAFVPAFSKKLNVSVEEAKLFAGQFFSILLISLTLTLILGEIFSPLIVKLIAPGFVGERFIYAVRLLREMFPYIFLVSLVAFYGGILNSLEHFFAPAFSTALFNLSLIIFGITLGRSLSVESLAIGVVFGGALQVLLQVYFLKKKEFLVKPLFSLRVSEDVKRTLKNTIPGIFSFAVRQVSMLIDTVIASFLKAGAISYLYYANRFVQLPLGMFAIGLSQVLLPRLSKRSGGEFREELKTGILLCSAVIVPSAVGLMFLGKAIVDLVYNHGAFNDENLNGTYYVLLGYSSGLFFFSLEKIITNAYYSLEEFKLPVKVAGYTLTFNLIVDLFFCFVLKLGAPGLALGTSLTSLLNVLTLIYFFRKLFKIDLYRTVFRSGLRYILLSIPVGIAAFLGNSIYFLQNSLILKVSVLFLTVVSAAAVYFLTLFIVKDEIVKVLEE
jgi:putative peptidoglycan lipid II flippase